jgi:hypothetical protein
MICRDALAKVRVSAPVLAVAKKSAPGKKRLFGLCRPDEKSPCPPLWRVSECLHRQTGLPIPHELPPFV